MGEIGRMLERIDLRCVFGVRVHSGDDAHSRSRRTIHDRGWTSCNTGSRVACRAASRWTIASTGPGETCLYCTRIAATLLQ